MAQIAKTSIVGLTDSTIYLERTTVEEVAAAEVEQRLEIIRGQDTLSEAEKDDLVQTLEPFMRDYVDTAVRQYGVQEVIKASSTLVVLACLALGLTFGFEILELPWWGVLIISPLELWVLRKSIRTINILGPGGRRGLIDFDFKSAWRLKNLLRSACASLGFALLARPQFGGIDVPSNSIADFVPALSLAVALTLWIVPATSIIRYLFAKLVSPVASRVSATLIHVSFKSQLIWSLLHLLNGIDFRGDPHYLELMEDVAADLDRHLPKLIRTKYPRVKKTYMKEVRSIVGHVRNWPSMWLTNDAALHERLRQEFVHDLKQIPRDEWLVWRWNPREPTTPTTKTFVALGRNAWGLLIGVGPAVALWLTQNSLIVGGFPAVMVGVGLSVAGAVAMVTIFTFLLQVNPFLANNPEFKQAIREKLALVTLERTRSSAGSGSHAGPDAMESERP